MPVDDVVTNKSDNTPFREVLTQRMSRRTVMTGSLATAAVAFFGGSSIAEAGKGGIPGPPAPKPDNGPKGPNIGFEPLTPNPGGPIPSISEDYRYQVLIPWGTPLVTGVKDISLTGGRPTSAEDAERQIGIGHDGMWFYPFEGETNHGILCINHEFGGNAHVLGGDPSDFGDAPEKVRISQAAHGVSVVEIDGRSGTWEIVQNSDHNRRITANSPIVFDGPVAGDELIGGTSEGFGTVNNCGNGYTPWGTYLTCEENFNGYFGYDPTKYTPTAEQERYGFSPDGFDYEWWKYDDRWNLGETPNEDNKFGWIVEIDPMDPGSKPVKHTALGRFKHEGFAFAEGKNGEAVGYMGDDQRFDYIYKFVSAGRWKDMLESGQSPFSEGTLYVAKFNANGTGDWLELSLDNPRLVQAIRQSKDVDYTTQQEVLTYARVCADLLGATPMDRPEWTTVAPNGDVYCTLTNNSRRTKTDKANPEAPNSDGHIIRWRDTEEHTGDSFQWDIFVLASSTRGTPYEFTDPDGLWADADGRIFIQTDGGQPSGNNQMLVANPVTGEIKRLLAGVAGDEITGIATTPDQRTLFCNSQHPGNGDPNLTNFPVLNETPDGTTIPRDATFVITRNDGGIVGS